MRIAAAHKQVTVTYGIFGFDISTKPARSKGARDESLSIAFLTVSLLIAVPLQAQIASATLSGTITDASGKGVANAKVSVKNLVIGQVVETQTDSAGLYGATNLVLGNYELSDSADGFNTNTAKVTIAQGAKQT